MTVRNALLGLLAQRPSHGYELRAAFEALAGGEENWEVKPAQIYTTLARLEEAGLIEETSSEKEGGPEKRVYAITHAGTEELRSWLAAGTKSEHQRDEFFLKLMIGLVTGEVEPRTMIQTQRTELYQKLHAVTTQRLRTEQRTQLAHILLLDKVVMHLEADLRWLDMIEARLDDVKKQPLPVPEPRPRGRPPKEHRK
jgi:DNA-binding PadR family transcriptional regulator